MPADRNNLISSRKAYRTPPFFPLINLTLIQFFKARTLDLGRVWKTGFWQARAIICCIPLDSIESPPLGSDAGANRAARRGTAEALCRFEEVRRGERKRGTKWFFCTPLAAYPQGVYASALGFLLRRMGKKKKGWEGAQDTRPQLRLIL